MPSTASTMAIATASKRRFNVTPLRVVAPTLGTLRRLRRIISADQQPKLIRRRRIGTVADSRALAGPAGDLGSCDVGRLVPCRSTVLSPQDTLKMAVAAVASAHARQPADRYGSRRPDVPVPALQRITPPARSLHVHALSRTRERMSAYLRFA